MKNNAIKKKKIKNYIIDKKNGDYVGMLDKDNNIFYMEGCYFGTIRKKNQIPFYFTLLLSIILVLILCVSLICWKPYPDKIKVYEIDSQIQWYSKTDLNIFNNFKFGGKKIIAPSDTGEYQFIVQNKTKKDIKINMLLEDINLQKINMKYKLKQESKYIVGNENDWESIESMKITNMKLEPKQSLLYTIEWKWEESNYDSIINEMAIYSLQISIKGY